MSNIVFKNLQEMGFIDDTDIIIYYNNHFASNGLVDCKGLDDCISLLIDVKYICEEEIKDDLIKYYETHLKHNTALIEQVIADAINEQSDSNTHSL